MRNKFIFLIYTHKKTFFKRKKILDYYCKTIKFPVFLVTGDLDVKHKNALYIDFKESYDQLGLKTYLAFKKIININFDYLIKLNDDTFFDINRFLKEKIKNYSYIGKKEKQFKNSNKSHFLKCGKEFYMLKNDNRNEYMEGGFVVLSKSAVKKILSIKKEYFLNLPHNYTGEDEKIGNILQNVKKLDLNSKYSDLLNMDITKNGISFHPVHESLFFSMINISFEEQIELLNNNSHKNEYNLLDLLRNNISRPQ